MPEMDPTPVTEAEDLAPESPVRPWRIGLLWTLLAVLPGIRGTVLDYDVWHEDPTRSAVSFAAVAFAFDSPAESPADGSPSSGDMEGRNVPGEER